MTEQDYFETYNQLVAQVRTIDPDAADYMENGAIGLDTFVKSGALDEAFIWCNTPQGHGYWQDIHQQLTTKE